MTTSGIFTLQYSTVVIRQSQILVGHVNVLSTAMHLPFHNWAFEAGHAGPHLSGYQYLPDSGLA